MFKKILIANRGEIAMRIIRACTELNIATAAIYSEADSTGIYVKKADEAYMVGPGPVKGFLDSQQIVDLAQRIGADAIHPGYGFLSENSQFAQLCHTSGVTFIGTSPQAIDLMGSKIKARELAKRIGVPIVPGTEGGITEITDALSFARDTGYPIMIKASAGGGGRGLRVVRSDTELRENMAVASREAQAAFGNGTVFLEKYIERPHHIEFQILADRHGNIIHLGERDCSIQRRHQKLIEIAPSLILTPRLRAEMGESAIAIDKAIEYDNAGTVEFLLDQDSRYYFMEMNPRLQVEHTVKDRHRAGRRPGGVGQGRGSSVKFRDHAWFVSFAPVEKPEIALSVCVEHGGHGGSVAAPIAKWKAIEAYLLPADKKKDLLNVQH